MDKRIKNIRILSILEIFFACIPCGAAALLLANSAKRLAQEEKMEEAEKQLKNAKYVLIAGVVIAVVLIWLHFVQNYSYI